MNLEEETGINPGWINNGGLFIASTKVNIFIKVHDNLSLYKLIIKKTVIE